MRILRSKPVLLLGGGALLRKAMQNAQTKRRKRRGAGRKVTGILLASAAGGALRYFSDTVSGPRRREKIMRLIGKGQESEGSQDQEWTGSDGDSPKPIQTQDSTSQMEDSISQMEDSTSSSKE